jgi:hypothetical protein
MDTFYLIILSIAVILLILFLTIVGIMMRRQRKDEIFPAIPNACPDGWTNDASNNCIVPTPLPPPLTDMILRNATVGTTVNTTANIKTYAINFNDPGWNGLGGKSAICAKRSWVNKNNVEWDGVSNYNSC